MKTDINGKISIENSTVLFCNTVNSLYFSRPNPRNPRPDVPCEPDQPHHPFPGRDFLNHFAQGVFTFVMRSIQSIQQDDSGSLCSDLGYDQNCDVFFKLSLCEEEILRQNIHKIVEHVFCHAHPIESEERMRNMLMLGTAVIHYFQDHQFFEQSESSQETRDLLISSLSFDQIRSYYYDNLSDPSFQVREVNGIRVFEDENDLESDRGRHHHRLA